jgi:hypothetical protein
MLSKKVKRDEKNFDKKTIKKKILRIKVLTYELSCL